MKRKHLEGLLQQFDHFEKPKIHLEQYTTPYEIASSILMHISQTYDDVRGKVVGDFGCGVGTLGFGAILMGAAFVYLCDIDVDAVNLCSANGSRLREEFPDANFEVVHADVTALPLLKAPLFDTIIMNPPFGTKQNEGIDVLFLNKALECTRGAVYSLHKSSTTDSLERKFRRRGITLEKIASLRYNLDASYNFHKKQSCDIKVDLIRIKTR